MPILNNMGDLSPLISSYEKQSNISGEHTGLFKVRVKAEVSEGITCINVELPDHLPAKLTPLNEMNS